MNKLFILSLLILVSLSSLCMASDLEVWITTKNKARLSLGKITRIKIQKDLAWSEARIALVQIEKDHKTTYLTLHFEYTKLLNLGLNETLNANRAQSFINFFKNVDANPSPEPTVLILQNSKQTPKATHAQANDILVYQQPELPGGFLGYPMQIPSARYMTYPFESVIDSF